MITLLPAPGSYGAAVISGPSLTGGPHDRGAVLMRAAFDLLGDGSGPRQPQLSPAGDRFALAMQDRFADPQQCNVDLIYESDFVLEKEKVDILVQGFLGPDSDGCVKVDHEIWLRRINPTHSDASEPGEPPPFRAVDIQRNLFGLHGRTESGRRLGSGTLASGLPSNYSAMFNNFYRRSSGFSAPQLQASLPSAGLVEIFHHANGHGVPAYALRLPATKFKARLRVAGPDCPDQPKRWAVAALLDLKADTLILRPEAHQAEMVWRAGWSWNDVEPSRFRGVQILAE